MPARLSDPGDVRVAESALDRTGVSLVDVVKQAHEILERDIPFADEQGWGRKRDVNQLRTTVERKEVMIISKRWSASVWNG